MITAILCVGALNAALLLAILLHQIRRHRHLDHYLGQVWNASRHNTELLVDYCEIDKKIIELKKQMANPTTELRDVLQDVKFWGYTVVRIDPTNINIRQAP